MIVRQSSIDRSKRGLQELGSAALGKIQTVSKRSLAVSRLRDAILSGKLKPGERLIERQLAEAMGISQVTLREAFQHLEHQGLIERKANAGTFVIQLSSITLREILEVRLHLEPLAMCLASRNLTAEAEQGLRDLATEIEEAIAESDQAAVSQADFRFHQTIWKLGGNETLVSTLTQLTGPYYAYVAILASLTLDELNSYLQSQPGFMDYFQRDMKARYESHQAIVAGLKSGDCEILRQVIRDHILGSWAGLLNAG